MKPKKYEDSIPFAKDFWVLTPVQRTRLRYGARGALASSDATGGSKAIQVNGQRDTQNRYSIDRIENMDYDAFTYSFSRSVDAIAEFRVDTANSGTDSGAAAGANVNQIIRSGTNGLHGTLFYFNRNNAFTQSYDALANKDAAPPT
jgi:hypothetical protein